MVINMNICLIVLISGKLNEEDLALNICLRRSSCHGSDKFLITSLHLAHLEQVKNLDQMQTSDRL